LNPHHRKRIPISFVGGNQPQSIKGQEQQPMQS